MICDILFIYYYAPRDGPPGPRCDRCHAAGARPGPHNNNNSITNPLYISTRMMPLPVPPRQPPPPPPPKPPQMNGGMNEVGDDSLAGFDAVLLITRPTILLDSRMPEQKKKLDSLTSGGAGIGERNGRDHEECSASWLIAPQFTRFQYTVILENEKRKRKEVKGKRGV
jgi:hypothetical protein